MRLAKWQDMMNKSSHFNTFMSMTKIILDWRSHKIIYSNELVDVQLLVGQMFIIQIRHLDKL